MPNNIVRTYFYPVGNPVRLWIESTPELTELDALKATVQALQREVIRRETNPDLPFSR